ncbi:hypothetical protein KCM76_25240 [Zooshikella marina]|uniref:hypothetical protein n=1 Tax=Zooshikella ganghwensis TaxID=202772 RepID=UPI001BAF5531|nr:hypothetical protein [Zooshikella ganghwensis]MBU2709325.1 hypothetical protein [Zooshikella ganghwensis]
MTMITLDAIEDIKKELSSLPEPKNKAISSNEAIRLMIDEIIELQKQGHTLKEIHTVISSKGVEISLRTFTQYVAEAKKNKPKKPKVRAKVETPSTPNSKVAKSSSPDKKATVAKPKQEPATEASIDNTIAIKTATNTTMDDTSVSSGRRSSFALKEDSDDI